MTVLTDPVRTEEWASYMRDPPVGQEKIGITKTQLRTVINSADDWVDANAASFNSAIPQPMRGLLTAKQKAALLARVISRRFKE